jgi:hypothetical protein
LPLPIHQPELSARRADRSQPPLEGVIQSSVTQPHCGS